MNERCSLALKPHRYTHCVCQQPPNKIVISEAAECIRHGLGYRSLSSAAPRDHEQHARVCMTCALSRSARNYECTVDRRHVWKGCLLFEQNPVLHTRCALRAPC